MFTKIRQNKVAWLLTKTFLIVVAAMLCAAGIGRLALSNTVRPPEIPAIAIAAAPVPLQEGDGFEGFTSGRGNLMAGTVNETADELPPPLLPQFEERRPMFFTFLIFGLTEGLNANTIMVAAYDAEAGRGYIISIPRDTKVDVPRNSRKIVSAYPVGRLGGRGHAGGVEQMKYEVSTLIGFKPDFYISVDYEAFVRLVDAVGGIEIYVPFHMRYDDPFQNLHIDLQPGLRVLNGRDALHFARYRTGNDRRLSISDYQRIEHQQQVLSAVFQELVTPASILRIPEFISIFNSYVDSDLTTGELIWFANQARSISGTDALHLYTLPMLGTGGPPRWYELADEEGILELVNRTINPFTREITAEDLRVVVE